MSVTQEDSIGKGKGKETVSQWLRTNLENRLYDFAHALSKCGRFCPRDRSFYSNNKPRPSGFAFEVWCRRYPAV